MYAQYAVHICAACNASRGEGGVAGRVDREEGMVWLKACEQFEECAGVLLLSCALRLRLLVSVSVSASVTVQVRVPARVQVRKVLMRGT